MATKAEREALYGPVFRELVAERDAKKAAYEAAVQAMEEALSDLRAAARAVGIARERLNGTRK